MIVARRLELQMSEIRRLEKNVQSISSTKNNEYGTVSTDITTNGKNKKTGSNIPYNLSQDSEKENTIAKAALSIAELGMTL